MSTIQITGLALFWFILGAFGIRSIRQAATSVRYRALLSETGSVEGQHIARRSTKSRFRLWLYGAGFETRHVVTLFVFIAFIFASIGISLTYTIFWSGVLLWVEDGLITIPGNIGQLFVPVVYIAPYLVAMIFISLPFIYVVGKRRRRAERVEEELPIFLEYLVTLSEAGLGFDEALGKVLDIKRESSVLGDVLRRFRKEVLAGNSRLDAYWRIRERLQTHPVKTFTSALIQAESSGGSIAGILRQQAEDALARRKLKALEMAHTLPVRLLFPMMCCFLPGLMTVLLGPLLFRMIEAVESMTRTVRG